MGRKAGSGAAGKVNWDVLTAAASFERRVALDKSREQNWKAVKNMATAKTYKCTDYDCDCDCHEYSPREDLVVDAVPMMVAYRKDTVWWSLVYLTVHGGAGRWRPERGSGEMDSLRGPYELTQVPDFAVAGINARLARWGQGVIES